MDASQQLRVLTLNCWGLPDTITKVISRKFNTKSLKGRRWPKRTERFAAIANKLDAFDVVCLQEVWMKEDQDLLRDLCKEKGLHYSHVFSSGIIGSSGLQIISRFPIKEVFFHKYRVNGAIYRLDHGDYHAGKGFGFARIAISATQSVSVIVTHTIARYSVEDDSYHADRLSQVWELIRFLQLTSRPHQPVIVVGDMNSRPTSVEYSMFTQVGKLVDSYEEFSSKNYSSSSVGITSMDEHPQRIDYIFFSKKPGWKLIDSKIVLNDTDILYSDHFGVSATFSFGTGTDLSSSSAYRKYLNSSISSSCDLDDEDELEYEAGTSPQFRCAKATLKECSGIILRGTERAYKRKVNHLIRCMPALLIVWLLVSMGAPCQYVALLLAYVLAEFLIAMFPVENEISALREVHNEIRYFF